MSNWSQNSPIQYKEYVSQNPVEAMTLVGVQREQKLQEGIKTVNDYYSQVAGVDILRPVDKEYLQSSLTSLKTGITKNLSGDFSDSRITNQILGAARQIYKDPNIQNAMISTAQVRKGQTEMDAARKAGKSNPNNEDYYNDKISKYVLSQNPEDSFNESYKPYTDVLGKVMELTSKAGIDSNVVDYIYNKKGLPTDVMTEEEYKTNMPKIKAAIDTVFADGNVRQQLQIDGWAKYRGVETEQLFHPFISSYKEKYNRLAEEEMDNQVLLSASGLKDEDRIGYEKKQKEIAKNIVNTQDEYESLKKLAETSPDQFKEMLYSTEMKSNLLNTLSSTSTSRSYKSNPAMEQYMKIINLNWDKEKEKNSNYYKSEDRKLALAKFELDYPVGADGQRYKAEGGKTKKTTEDLTQQPNPSGGNITDQEKLYSTFDSNLLDLGSQVNQGSLDVYTEYLSLVNNGKLKDGRIITPKLAMENAKANASANGEKVEDYLLRFALNANSKLEDSKLKAPAQIQAKIETLKNKQELHQAYVLAKVAGNKAGEEAAGTTANEIGKMVVPSQPAYLGSFGLPPSMQFNTPIRTKEGLLANQKYVDARNQMISKIVPAFNNLSTQGVDLKDSKAKLLEFVNTTPSLAGVPSGDREAIVEALTKDEAGLSFNMQQPLFTGQPWVANAIVSYKGKEYNIPGVPTNTTGKTFQPYEIDPDEILIKTTKTNSTSVINPNAKDAPNYAHYSPSKFAKIDPKSPYVVKGNIAKVANPSGGPDGDQLILYIKEGNGEFKNIQGPVIYPNAKIPSPIGALKQYISQMTDADVQHYLKENK